MKMWSCKVSWSTGYLWRASRPLKAEEKKSGSCGMFTEELLNVTGIWWHKNEIPKFWRLLQEYSKTFHENVETEFSKFKLNENSNASDWPNPFQRTGVLMPVTFMCLGLNVAEIIGTDKTKPKGKKYRFHKNQCTQVSGTGTHLLV